MKFSFFLLNNSFYIPFRKATSLCRSFGPAWLALGHSYGLESEHDHAISAYFTAADVMRGYVEFWIRFPMSFSSSLVVIYQSFMLVLNIV
jgi:anaphase-promoting complex subunit 6